MLEVWRTDTGMCTAHAMAVNVRGKVHRTAFHVAKTSAALAGVNVLEDDIDSPLEKGMRDGHNVGYSRPIVYKT